MIAVGVLLHGYDPARDDISYLFRKIFSDLDLGSGDRHGLGKLAVFIFIKAYIDKFVKPFSGKQHLYCLL